MPGLCTKNSPSRDPLRQERANNKGHTGIFPDPRDPKILWHDFALRHTKDSNLHNIHDRLKPHTSKWRMIASPPQDSFIPQITLARIHQPLTDYQTGKCKSSHA